LIDHTATAAAGTGACINISSRSATAADEERLHGQQFPRICNASERPLHGRNGLSA
jgi:hypothetical protein